MGRPTLLVSKIHQLESEIEEWAARNGRRPDRLYRELWDVLTGDASFEGVSECSRRAAGLAKWIEHHLRRDRLDALGKALLEHTQFGASRASVCRGWEVRPSEWQYLRELARWVGEKIRRGVALRSWPAAWLSEVEEFHETMEVVVEDRAVRDMLLGALEAYTVPRGPGSRYSEVYGVCFGSVKRRERTVRGEGRQDFLDVTVQRVALQLRAKTAAGYFIPDPRSQAIQLEMARELFPHVDLVGDFHSHPFVNLERLRASRGWDYTAADEQFNRDWVQELREEGYRPRVGIILALARGRRRVRGVRPVASNVLRATLGRCHCYLAAYRINRDGTYNRSDIALRCPTLTGLGT